MWVWHLFDVTRSNRLEIPKTYCRFSITTVKKTPENVVWSPNYYFSWKTDYLFLPVTFTVFSRVSPPPLKGCHPAPFLPVRPRLSTVLCKFSHNFFSFGCHPWSVEGVTRGGPPPPLSLPSDATGKLWSPNLIGDNEMDHRPISYQDEFSRII